MTLFDLIFAFYNDYVFNSTNLVINGYLTNPTFNIGGVNFSMQHYICFLCALITSIAIVLFCIFIIKKIIGIIFRLFTGSSSF